MFLYFFFIPILLLPLFLNQIVYIAIKLFNFVNILFQLTLHSFDMQFLFNKLFLKALIIILILILSLLNQNFVILLLGIFQIDVFLR